MNETELNRRDLGKMLGAALATAALGAPAVAAKTQPPITRWMILKGKKNYVRGRKKDGEIIYGCSWKAIEDERGGIQIFHNGWDGFMIAPAAMGIVAIDFGNEFFELPLVVGEDI